MQFRRGRIWTGKEQSAILLEVRISPGMILTISPELEYRFRNFYFGGYFGFWRAGSNLIPRQIS